MPPGKNHTASLHPHHFPLAAARDLVPPPGSLSSPVFEHGSLVVRLYHPRVSDPQKPHTRDEIYVIASGRGAFVNGEVRHGFGPGDALFVPAGVVHRFEDFDDDLVVWVMFYGPEGGE
ncbi:MAG: cupin domain-containing protein [Burkholderiales bacterium]